MLRGRVARELFHAKPGTTRRKGQIDLFTRRVRKPPPAPEFNLQCMVADILRRWIAPGWRYTHIASGEKRSKATAGRLKRMGVVPGWPDFILLAPSPATLAHFLELKRRGRGLDEDQEAFAAYCLTHGYPHEWTDDFETAVAILKSWGAIQTRVSA
jgi:hypothetical protein